MFLKTAAVACLLMIFVGCNKKDAASDAASVATIVAPKAPEPTYKGKSRSEWIAQAKDTDADTRVDAIIALSFMCHSDDVAEQAIIAALEDTSHKVRYTAFAFAFTMTDEQRLTAMLDMAKSADADHLTWITTDDFVYGAQHLHDKGATLIPYLRPIREELSKRLEADGQTIDSEAVGKLRRTIGYLSTSGD
jgi:hypothetical protein